MLFRSVSQSRYDSLNLKSRLSDSTLTDSTKNQKKKDKIDAEIKYTTSDSIVFTGNGTAYLHGQGDVTYKNINLKADFMRIKLDSSTIFAKGTADSLGKKIGEPEFSEGDKKYNSKELTYNFKSKKGCIRQAVTQEGEGVKARVNQIKAEISNTTSEYDKEKLQERLAKLSGGVAVIKVGAATETEMKEKKDRVDDALSATRAAVEEGIVIGGGAALIRAASKVKLDLEGDEAIGAAIVLRAIKAPMKQIAINAGFDAGVVVNEVEKSSNDNLGFNAATGEYVDMFEAGIVDPAKVERVAMQNAVSVASLLLTTEATVTDIKEDKPAMPAMPDMGNYIVTGKQIGRAHV